MAVIAGLKLDLSITNSLSVKLAQCAWGFLLILFNILVNGLQAAYNFYHASEDTLDILELMIVEAAKAVDVACRMDLMIGGHYYYRYLLLFLGVPLTLYVHLVLTGKWKKLWLNLQTIQNEFRPREEFYSKCRNQCYLGLVFFFLVNDFDGMFFLCDFLLLFFFYSS